MWISRDKLGTRLTPDKPIWNGSYFIRQKWRETPIQNELHNLEIGESKQVKWINTATDNINIMDEIKQKSYEELKQEYIDYKTRAEKEIQSLKESATEANLELERVADLDLKQVVDWQVNFPCYDEA